MTGGEATSSLKTEPTNESEMYKILSIAWQSACVVMREIPLAESAAGVIRVEADSLKAAFGRPRQNDASVVKTLARCVLAHSHGCDVPMPAR